MLDGPGSISIQFFFNSTGCFFLFFVFLFLMEFSSTTTSHLLPKTGLETILRLLNLQSTHAMKVTALKSAVARH